MKKLNLPFKNKVFSSENEVLCELLSQVLMFGDSFIKLRMLTNREEYTHCSFDVDFVNLPFDLPFSDMVKYINVWRENIDKKIDHHESESYIFFEEKGYKIFIEQLSLNQYAEEIKETFQDIESTSINLTICLKELEARDGKGIISELFRRFYPFDLPFESVSSEIRIWVNNML